MKRKNETSNPSGIQLTAKVMSAFNSTGRSLSVLRRSVESAGQSELSLQLPQGPLIV